MTFIDAENTGPRNPGHLAPLHVRVVLTLPLIESRETRTPDVSAIPSRRFRAGSPRGERPAWPGAARRGAERSEAKRCGCSYHSARAATRRAPGATDGGVVVA